MLNKHVSLCIVDPYKLVLSHFEFMTKIALAFCHVTSLRIEHSMAKHNTIAAAPSRIYNKLLNEPEQYSWRKKIEFHSLKSLRTSKSDLFGKMMNFPRFDTEAFCVFI